MGAALADLPEEECADLLDELAAHLDELSAEGTDALEPRLGSPEEYAAGQQVWDIYPYDESKQQVLDSTGERVDPGCDPLAQPVRWEAVTPLV